MILPPESLKERYENGLSQKRRDDTHFSMNGYVFIL